MWDEYAWITTVEGKIPDCKHRRGIIYDELFSRGCFVRGGPEQGGPFLRFIKYVASALVEANKSREGTMKQIEELVAFVDRAKEVNKQQAYLPDA
ncbi:hypothetical protein QBC33DRAFT_572716 [Phialemonium atrogriseum]|uniref:Uncharacterized protein n=1 Tax=Phialemonium atrogriseum TaxID=1093897 RepID=A0AAJ0FIG0_9PEZI|nr:uncharacterized protein QBC33DRAFT_572716 [Phialemonium atrogriseum]KAK1764338.1 hypothetical protein QBC33DRAFT_572716 [Phialemonium atrogriseum]